ncbi:hypothetical protein GCM10011328_40440 [Hafnia psychrotolerans]|uniref:Uncharacterized protein n=1 Tax=Hafnia psychrotolerans TaxID=1477018 RepID=A0ABQ1H6J2_9GAMM|nr:hypothetical protein GCM10011328_40440 [Hafnia psychrotolerans]
MKEYTTQAEHADLDAWLDSHLESLNWMQVITLVLVDLNKRGKVRDIVEHSWFQRKALLNGRTDYLSQTAWTALQSYTVPESKTVDYKNRREPAVFDKTTDSVWFLADSQLEQVEDLVALHAKIRCPVAAGHNYVSQQTAAHRNSDRCHTDCPSPTETAGNR